MCCLKEQLSAIKKGGKFFEILDKGNNVMTAAAKTCVKDTFFCFPIEKQDPWTKFGTFFTNFIPVTVIMLFTYRIVNFTDL